MSTWSNGSLCFTNGSGQQIRLTRSDQAFLLRKLLTAQHVFTKPETPPFVVCVTVDYETDHEQTTPCRHILMPCFTHEAATKLMAWVTATIRKFDNPGIFGSEILPLPEKDFFLQDLVPRAGDPIAAFCGRFHAELLETFEHIAAVGEDYWETLTKGDWAETVKASSNKVWTRDRIVELVGAGMLPKRVKKRVAQRKP